MIGELNRDHLFQEQVTENEEIQNLRKRLKSSHWNLFLVLLIVVSLAICMFQQNSLAKAKEKEAYLVSLVVTEYEDILLFKYQMLPEHIGLGEYREAWVNNPCYDTIFPYYEKLSEAVEQLENGTSPDSFFNERLMGSPLPC